MRLTLAILACAILAACGDPIADIPRLADQDIPETAPTVDIAASPASQDGGILAELLSEAGAEAQNTARDEAVAEQGKPAKRGGLFALFAGSDAPEPSVDGEKAKALTASEPQVIQASAPEPKNIGIFGLGSGKAKTPPAVSEVPPGTLLPPGRVARICGMSKRQLGKNIAQFPERNPRHKIYDSNPGSDGPRSFFVSGFDDGCVRQFTAALAMFGSVEMHEQLRYGLPAEVQPYSDTDKAYEKLKSKMCNVPRKKPCGKKISKMSRNTVFISIYERFGSNPHWSNLLLHDGSVLAQDKKGG